MRKFKLLGGVVAALVLSASGAQAVELVTNGDFATGDFTGWTLYTTANGTLGVAPAPQVASFDVTGSGASNAAELEVGEVDFTAVDEGGGLFQSITTIAGLLNFSADFAALGRETVPNSAGGVFSVLLDGVVKASFNAGPVDPLEVKRGTLTFSEVVTAGSHVLSVQAARPFKIGTQYYSTPLQYFDNISATQGAVPEPATWALMIAGFGLAGGALRRRGAIASRAR
ncbi:MAG: PEP-CTERM sorting domain-containing protein [Phenylobacterium sp.]|uniref:PEPxxWA-CTERM sorting domain-containing protein n=1 Tax=Phenylobacterium sp. TaxID=1871053 RepID=UPI0025DEB028|nr:PEPxxWA-CTERM sorting domain-containing protein [Phenylobacterium sp.]MBI1199428.1 PEP-CTERM sorting domain-containing protein [Phenylobacterium sp.]